MRDNCAARPVEPGPWFTPDWAAPAPVRAVFTTRGAAGAGASAPPFEHFNLGDHVGDAASAVAANRARLAAAIGARPVFLRQVHGTDVAVLGGASADGAAADAAVTRAPGVACTVLVADCLPVLLCDAAGRTVAAAHAGWRGLAAGVIESTLKHFTAPARTNAAPAAIESEANEVIAWLGPCIGPAVFEVGGEVRAAFLAQDAGAEPCFAPGRSGRWLADLPQLARRRLAAAGVARVYGNDGSARWCTVRDAARFYSYRRDQTTRGATGRMAACVWLAPG